MRETANGRRFRREMILDRVQRHLANRGDTALSKEARKAIFDAWVMVMRIVKKAKDEDLKAGSK